MRSWQPAKTVHGQYCMANPPLNPSVVIPGVTLANIFAVVHDYDRHGEFYKPTMVKSALLFGSGGKGD